MKVLKGFCYCVTAATDTTVTDDNGLSLTVKAGEQGYFVASTDEVSESGTCTIVQVRGNFNMPTTTGGGGGPVINGMYVENGELKGNGFNILADVTTVTKNLDTSKISDGSYMFYYSKLTSCTAELPNLTNGSSMFYNCSSLTSWTVDLPNLTNGSSMFYNCYNPTSWTVDLPELTNGSSMFYNWFKLTSWTVDLPKLTNGERMFEGCSSLTSWTVDLSNLTNGSNMFISCSGLTSFSGDLSKLAGTSSTNRWL